ncbi:hypothetical protein BD94_0745 [Elizabethkingia anophelis NUHP1]|uniref:Uncharacterized protein n=1 Tax=Elizabethkingia anophelis NUHP1 TaxID=1338011 RepID=A0A077EG59_9FLAO|nr:hypothetical protein BD94_0745 [Elizabethkingia anophelis NUHP1]
MSNTKSSFNSFFFNRIKGNNVIAVIFVFLSKDLHTKII